MRPNISGIAPAASADDRGREPEEIQLALFRLGEALFGVDIMRIREIVQPQRLSPLPEPSPSLEGVMHLRGSVIAVMSLARRLGLASAPVGDSARLLIVRYAGMLLALEVDEVIEVMTVPAVEIKPPPENGGNPFDFVLGTCRSGAALVRILDVDALPDPDRILNAVSPISTAEES